jgi:hypothetical protein
VEVTGGRVMKAYPPLRSGGGGPPKAVEGARLPLQQE